MNAQERRRAARAEKQSAWKQSNPLLVGVKAKPQGQATLSLKRKPKSRVEMAASPIDLSCLADYRQNMENIADEVERRNHRIWHRKPGEQGVTCHGRQKQRGKSIPLI